MNVLELFAGSRSIGKVAEKLGHTVFSVDWEYYDKINLVTDIGKLMPIEVPFVPDIVWASPDCTTYTIAAISTHRNGVIPKTDYAKKCDSVNIHVISLLEYWLKKNPNMKFYIENPRGMLRKMPFMVGIPRTTIWYCKYGDMRAKPTDIFTNNLYNPIFNPNGWKPREECFNGNTNCHHESAPRGSKTGTQGIKGHYNRSIIPEQLCFEVLKSI